MSKIAPCQTREGDFRYSVTSFDLPVDFMVICNYESYEGT